MLSRGDALWPIYQELCEAFASWRMDEACLPPHPLLSVESQAWFSSQDSSHCPLLQHLSQHADSQGSLLVEISLPTVTSLPPFPILFCPIHTSIKKYIDVLHLPGLFGGKQQKRTLANLFVTENIHFQDLG